MTNHSAVSGVICRLPAGRVFFVPLSVAADSLMNLFLPAARQTTAHFALRFMKYSNSTFYSSLRF